jgi:hypothetical protein
LVGFVYAIWFKEHHDDETWLPSVIQCTEKTTEPKKKKTTAVKSAHQQYILVIM